MIQRCVNARVKGIAKRQKNVSVFPVYTGWMVRGKAHRKKIESESVLTLKNRKLIVAGVHNQKLKSSV